MPTLLQNGQPVMPVHAQIYYRRSTQRHVEAFPPGFRMVAGDAKATAAQARRITFWNCGVAGGVRASTDVPTCPNARRAALRLHVTFPSCWDGKNLDSASHQSHVAYPVAGRCPSRYSHALPQISLIYRYPIAGGCGRDARLGRVPLGACRLLQRLAPGRAAVARGRVPERASALPAGVVEEVVSRAATRGSRPARLRPRASRRP